jgi:putative ABC transport system ATP-binding protein
MEYLYYNKDKVYKPFGNSEKDYPKYFRYLKDILSADKSFLGVIAFFSIAVSILSIAVPISVQYLISSVSYTSLLQPILVLGTILAILLSFFGILSALQFFVTELFRQRFMARMVAEITLRLVYSDYKETEKSNLSELVNRFFDISSIQKTVPKFFIKTISFLMQMVVGLVFVAFYHPFLLIFSIIIAVLFYLIHKLYFRKGCITAFFESRSKYDIAGWLEDISHNIPIFKSEAGRNYAKFKSDILSSRYIRERKRHFKNLFSQVILLLILYILASSILLVLGGWLVLKEQLTIGQLVASELILSAILYGIASFGHDLENIYDIVASCEKLTHFFNIPLDTNRLGNRLEDKISSISLKDVSYKYADEQFNFNLEFEGRKKYLITSDSLIEEKVLIKLMGAYLNPESGSITYNGKNLSGLDLFSLRSKIIMIDNMPLFEGSIREYITFNDNRILQEDIEFIAKKIGFDKVMKKYNNNYGLRIIPSGWPLLESEKLLLKILRSLVHKPEVLIITEVMDILPSDKRQKILAFISSLKGLTLLYFSNQHQHGIEFDEYLFLENEGSESFSKIADFIQYKQESDAK